MIPLTQESILAYLKEKNWDPLIQKETGQLYATFKINNTDIPVFFLVISDATVFQIIAYAPFSFTDKTKSDVANLLHLINKEIDMPGFGMDDGSVQNERLIFYRLVIPCLEKMLNTKIFDIYLRAIQKALQTFIGAINAVASGKTSFDTLLNDFKKRHE